MNVEQVLFDLADALRYPVLVAALLALAVAAIEVGALVAEIRARRGRDIARVEQAIAAARSALHTGDVSAAQQALRPVAHTPAMAALLDSIVALKWDPDRDHRIAKRLAEYDHGSLRRLERTRILVRMGPALGLMGTLIPLSPALAGLARGDVAQLSRDLRVAFSVTVVGLLCGAVAFAISLVRDRLYAQDYSDVEFIAATISKDSA